MAIGHLHMVPLSRSAGRSATAAAAYRACALVRDERTGEVFDYRRKRSLTSAQIVMPDGSTVDRSELWNAVERSERRVNSVVAREIVVALPVEFEAEPLKSQRVNERLVRLFSTYLAQKHGVAVDACIHKPDKKEGLNWHCHLMISTRRVERDEAGAIRLGDKTRELDHRPTGQKAITEWRTKWEQLVNASLMAHDIDASIDLRSLKDQGIEREPNPHLGPKRSAELAALAREEREVRRQLRTLMLDRSRAKVEETGQEIRLQRRPAKIEEKAPERPPMVYPTPQPEPIRIPEPVPPQRTRYWEPKKPVPATEQHPVPAAAAVTPAPARTSTPALAPTPVPTTPAPVVPPRPRLDLAAQMREAAAQRRPAEPAKPAPALEEAPAPAPTATVTPRQDAPPRAAAPPEVPAALRAEPVQPEQTAPARNGPIPISPFQNRKGEPRDPTFVLAASTILHAHDTGNAPLLRAATRLLAAVIDRTFKIAELAAGQLIAWGRENSRAGLPRPIQTPEACLDRAQNIQRNRGGRGL